jgi:hypothetical protein
VLRVEQWTTDKIRAVATALGEANGQLVLALHKAVPADQQEVDQQLAMEYKKLGKII